MQLVCPRILHNHCFQFLLGTTVVLREIEDNGYAKFWWVNKLHIITVYVKMVNCRKQPKHFSENALFDCGFGSRASPRLVAWKPPSVT